MRVLCAHVAPFGGFILFVSGEPRLKASRGGLELAGELLTLQLYKHARILFCVSQPIWAEHARRAVSVRNPAEALQHYISMTGGLWLRNELAPIVSCSFRSSQAIGDMVLVPRCKVLGACTRRDLRVSTFPNRLRHSCCRVRVPHQ